MKKFIFFAPSGLPAFTASPSKEDEYVSGETYLGSLCVEIPFETNDEVALNSMYLKDGQIKAKPPRPEGSFEWSVETEQWVEQAGGISDDLHNEQTPPRPTPYHVWDGAQWVEDLDLAKEFVRSQWNEWRDNEIAGDYNGFHLNSDFLLELSLILSGHQLEVFPVDTLHSIRKIDNTNVFLNKDQCKQLLIDLGTQRQVIYQRSWDAKDSLAQMTTVSQVLGASPYAIP